ncbi:hypothetical protein ACF0H5_002003 [Mactra antiquata]
MEDINLDLLIVTDYNDFLHLFALRIICALHSVFENYAVETRRLYKAKEDNFKCKRILFITWGFSDYTKPRVTELLNKISVTKKRRYIINVTGDSYGKPLDTLDVNATEFCDLHILKVHQIKHAEQWWPQVVQFLFNVSIPKTSIYMYNLTNDSSCHKTAVCTCLEYFNIPHSDKSLNRWSGCNICLVTELPAANMEDINTVYFTDNYWATPKTNNQYKVDQILTFLTQVYARTGVINGSILKSLMALLANLISHLMHLSLLQFLVNVLQALRLMSCLFFPTLSLLIAFPTAGTVITFIVLEPSDWPGLFVLCCWHTLMAFITVPFVIYDCDREYDDMSIKHTLGAVFHVIAGLTNIVILIVITVNAEFHEGKYIKNTYTSYNGDRAYHAFVMFLVDLIVHSLWIPTVLFCPKTCLSRCCHDCNDLLDD